MMNTSNFMPLGGGEVYCLPSKLICMKNMDTEDGAGHVPERQQGNMAITIPPGRSSLGVNKNMDFAYSSNDT